MKIVIDIPDDDYEFVKEQVDTEYCNDVRQINNRLYQIIANGTVLPKGHGRLIDADSASKDINAFQDAFAMYTDNMGKYNIVCAAPTVIEADKEAESEEV